MNREIGVAAALTVLVAFQALAQESFHCENTEGRAQAKIVGGQPARIDNWPWQVWVVSSASDGQSLTCGGSIIAPRWILTAAHCLTDDNGTHLADLGFEFSVVFGEDRPQTNPGVPVDRLIPHERFNRPTLANDIALIRLTRNIPGKRSIQLSSERTDRVFARPGLCATVTGWGTTTEGGTGSGTLQRADLPIVATGACNEAYPDKVTSRNICAGYEQGGVDSCQGDSGGPLIVRHGESNRYVQVGVVSWGYGCAQPGNPGIYTRVSEYISWIQSHTGR